MLYISFSFPKGYDRAHDGPAAKNVIETEGLRKMTITGTYCPEKRAELLPYGRGLILDWNTLSSAFDTEGPDFFDSLIPWA